MSRHTATMKPYVAEAQAYALAEARKVGVAFDIRHNQSVRLLATLCFGPRDQVSVGTVGRVVGMKAAEGRAQYLIKWHRKVWPTVAWCEQIELVAMTEMASSGDKKTVSLSV